VPVLLRELITRYRARLDYWRSPCWGWSCSTRLTTVLDRRLDQLAVSPEIRQALNDQRMRLAAAEIPSAADEQTRSILKQTIDECFIAGFRRVMLVGSVLLSPVH